MIFTFEDFVLILPSREEAEFSFMMGMRYGSIRQITGDRFMLDPQMIWERWG